MVLWLLMLALAAACSAHAAGGAAAAAQTSAPACHDKQKKADGTCCPSGQAYEFSSDTCFAVGPPECAEVVFNNPEKCVPKWCWDWQDADKKPCKAFSDGCDTAGRLCTSEEIAAGGGCPAGTFPITEKLGDCAPAGYFPGSGVPRDWNGDLATLPPVPPLAESIPLGVPPLTSLPDLNNSFLWVDEKSSVGRFCDEEQMQLCQRGPKGEMPDDKRCAYVGVAWPSVCPPSFVVDTKAKLSAGQPPPCVPDPADCGLQIWPEVPDQAIAIYVNATGGNDLANGTKDKPVKTIGRALQIVPIGGTVAVAAGVYTESLTVGAPLAIRGRCAAKVRVDGNDGEPALQVVGKKANGELMVSGVRFGGKGKGILVDGGLGVRLERVMVEGVTVGGIYVTGNSSTLSAQSLVVSGPVAPSTAKTLGPGIEVMDGAKATLTDTRLSANHQWGLVVSGVGSQVDATQLFIDETLAVPATGLFGWGAAVGFGGRLKVQGGRFTRNRGFGVFVGGKGAALDASGLLVDGTQQDAKNKSGQGLSVNDGGEAKLERTRVSGGRQAGIDAHGAGTVLDAQGLLIDGTLPQASDGKGGRGLAVEHGAQASLDHVRLSGNREVALLVIDADTFLDAKRVLVDHTEAQQSDKNGGTGIGVTNGAQLKLRDARLSANRSIGFLAQNAGTFADAAGLLIDGTLSEAKKKTAGRGASVADGASMMLQNVRLSGNRETAIFAGGSGSTLDAAQLLVEGTLAQESNALYGRGMTVQSGAFVRLRGARLSANRESGISIGLGGATVNAVGLLVNETLPQEATQRFGLGIGLQDFGTARVQGTRLVGNYSSGVSAMFDTSFHAVGLMVESTRPDQSNQTGGSGIWLVDRTDSTLISCGLRGNQGVGLAADNSTFVARGLTIISTLWGDYPEFNAAGRQINTVPLADGMMLSASASSLVDQCLFVGNLRAALLVDTSPSFKVVRSIVNGAKGNYGIDFQHSLDAVDQFNAVFGAGIQDRAKDAGLALATPPAPVEALAIDGKSP